VGLDDLPITDNTGDRFWHLNQKLEHTGAR
jgi:hypothetical protein